MKDFSNASAPLSQLLSVLKRHYKNTCITNNKITCIGHDNIDVDSFFSGLLLSKLLWYLGIRSEFIILDSVQLNDTYYVIKNVTGIDIRNFVFTKENPSRNLFLVDHYETKHAGSVIGCIDHHPTIQENTCPFSYVKNSCAATYMVYELMKEANYPLTAEEITYVVLAMLVDTVAFQSTKTVPEEVIIAQRLSTLYHLDYNYLKKMSLCLTPIETMNISEIISNGQKSYNYNGHKVISSYVQLYGIPGEEIIQNWIQHIKENVISTRIDLAVFIIFDTENGITYEYQINGNIYDMIVHNTIISRGKNIMPRIEKKFN